MKYEFAIAKVDYSHYSSGRVFYGAPSHPGFPVRLTSEIFQRCLRVRQGWAESKRLVVYDPCCGSGYQLATLAYLHWNHISKIIASDVDHDAISLARRNLSLLTLGGLDERIAELMKLHKMFAKGSHQSAIDSAHVLRDRLLELTRLHEIPTLVFQADATSPQELVKHVPRGIVDLVITDVPYGFQSQWQRPDGADESPALLQFLDSLSAILSDQALVAISADKGQRITHSGYERLERLKVGKRQAVILRPLANGSENAAAL